MDKSASIYIAGHRGLVGSALLQCLSRAGYQHLITRRHDELDLTNQSAVLNFFAQQRPDYVLLAAAKVGGIAANNTYPADFIHQNLLIQIHVIHAAWQQNVKRLLFLGSSCIYPRDCPQPIKEDYLLTGRLESTNRPYALAKIAGIEMCSAYNRQYGTRFLAVMPTNLYGPGDNYHLDNSHVLPALIRKFHEAKTTQQSQVNVWGTGEPRREFLYSADLADACLFLMQFSDEPFDRLLTGDEQEVDLSSQYMPLINIGFGEDLSIRELVKLVQGVVNYTGEVIWDTSKPDGTRRKLLDSSRLHQLGWYAKTPLVEGIKQAYADYCQRQASSS